MMANQELQSKAVEALVALNAAIKNIRLYPPASAMVQKSIERVLSFMETILASREDLSVAESEKNLLILGVPLTEKEQQKPQVTAFIATLLDFGIKSIVFKQGVTLTELEPLLKTLSRKAEDVMNEGGLLKVLASSNMPHIILDEKVYMALDQDQAVVSKTEAAQARTHITNDADGQDQAVVPQTATSQTRPTATMDVKVAQLKAGLKDLMQGRGQALDDADFVNSLPNTISQLVNKGKLEVVETLTDRILEGLETAAPETRPAIVQALQSSIQNLPAAKQDALQKAIAAKDSPETVASQGSPVSMTDQALAPEPPGQDQTAESEARIDELVAADDTDSAVKMLFELIVANAKRKNFNKAEELRDRLYDVDAMALTEILKAGEIIEQAKTESIDQDQLELWAELYNTLTEEETNELFHAMEDVSFDIDQTVFAQGRKNQNLYFVTEGSLKLVYQDGEKETLLKTLEKGDVAGHTTFFTISMCTTSLITLSSVAMKVLPRTALDQWEESAPALKSKLEDYCLKLEKAKDIIKEKGMERRKQERFNVKGKILVQLLSKKRQPMGKPFKGDFSDISEGGLSFFIITSKRETARMLLGRRLGMKFLIPTRAAPLKTFQQGTVICVNYHLKNDYSIHVSFDGELPAGIAGAIRRLKNIKSE